MGASNSFLQKIDIYLSFPEENEFVIGIKRKLLELNYNICDSSIVKKKFGNNGYFRNIGSHGNFN